MPSLNVLKKKETYNPCYAFHFLLTASNPRVEKGMNAYYRLHMIWLIFVSFLKEIISEGCNP
ncbi:hypothetical protein T10_11175 [Trichinella papuae]|uniref:Uncharacterized protein n=1 Tax=Trichinella papuae TaxID=268474 RepID=A0A0V1MIA9_9BILA|nr:hypothetical protein T10_11175 [Trichinella papuae]